jgi:hypothetical protein
MMTTRTFSIIEPTSMKTERNMKTRRSLSTAVLWLVGGAVAGLLAAATPAYAQVTASSTFSVPVSVKLVTPIESVACTGPLKVSAVTVRDPIMPPSVVFSFDSRGLSCVGETSKIAYINSGQANLTRPLVPVDVIETTFAYYQDVPGGYLKARTAVATLNVSYNTTTGALTGATGSISAF